MLALILVLIYLLIGVGVTFWYVDYLKENKKTVVSLIWLFGPIFWPFIGGYTLYLKHKK